MSITCLYRHPIRRRSYLNETRLTFSVGVPEISPVEPSKEIHSGKVPKTDQDRLSPSGSLPFNKNEYSSVTSPSSKLVVLIMGVEFEAEPEHSSSAKVFDKSQTIVLKTLLFFEPNSEIARREVIAINPI